MHNTIRNIEDLPKGYFRIHWPQCQVLMDYPDYDVDVIHCIDDAAVEDLQTVALPLKWISLVEKELGQKTKTYIQFINQKMKLN